MVQNNEALDNFIATAKGAGIPRDQLENFIKSSYAPLPWQCKFHALARECDKSDGPTELGVGGARGPGKSYSVFAQVSLDDCQRIDGLKFLFLRQTGKAAKESFEDLILKVLTGKIKYHYRGSNNVLVFPNGSRVILGGFENESDIDKYIGIEYDGIAIEEVNQLTEGKVEMLLGSMRTSKENWRPRLYTSFNPGGLGHAFIKERFILPYLEKKETKRRFIPATWKDNPYLNKEYIDYLHSLTGHLGKAWREGDWDIFAGQYFSEWSREHHVINPFPIPESWKKFRSYDHGREAPACCKWYALDYDNRLWVYREFYQSGLNVDQIAEKIITLSGDEQYQFSVADAAIFAKTGFIDRYGGETIASTFARHGVQFIPSSKNRIAGWTLMHQYLYWTEHQPPKMIYFNTCYDSIRTIPTLIHDEHKPEDLNTGSEDHCFAGNTKIDTLFGKKKIKDLVGKEIYVNTLRGFQKCQNIRKTRKVAVYKIILKDKREIISTLDHRFLTNNGWKKLKDIDIRYDVLIELDICIKSYLKLFKNLMESAIIYAVNTFRNKVKDCIWLFGNIIMGKFQKDFISITKMGIEAIMIFPIWKKLKHFNICHYMQKRQKQEIGLENQSKKQYYSLLNGTNQKQGEYGIVFMQKKSLKNGNGLKKIVLFVEKSIKRLNNLLSSQSIAIKIAKLLPYGEEEVYNLTVPNIEHFTIEGGIVVHNCADVDRYLLQKLQDQRTPPPITEIEKKINQMREEKQSISNLYEPDFNPLPQPACH